MKFFVCRVTPFNYTLIPYTDLNILEATKHFFPDTTDCYLNADEGGYAEHLQEMRDAYDSGVPMITFDTVGKVPFHKSPHPIERHRLSYFSDAPYNSFAKYVDDIPAGYTVTYSDRSFQQYYDDISSKLNYIFMPHGGPNKILCDIPMEDREIPISFIGRLRNPIPSGGFEKILEGSDPKVISIFREASQQALHEDVDVYIAYRNSCLRAGLSPFSIINKTKLPAILQSLTKWIEDQKRISLLREFKNYPLHIYGPIKDEIKGITDQNHHIHGLKTGAEVLEILQNTRILINSVGVFPEGSHERIWFSIASGCMPYTDPSRYMKETFENDKSILFIDYENKKEDTQRVINYAENPLELQKIMKRAQPIYLQNHTWMKRLETTFKEMSLLDI